MQQVNLHQQKLIALIIAVVALISLLLGWSAPKEGFFGVQSENGFHSWGLLSLVGILGVLAATFMGDKMKPYEGQTKQIALGAFGAIGLGAAIFLIRLLTGSQSNGFQTIKFSDIAKPGIGLFLCLIAGIAGIVWVMGLVKLPTTNSSTPGSTPPPPPPPKS